VKIIAYNVGHDGALVTLDDGRLVSCCEIEKDNGLRHASISPNDLVRFIKVSGLPDAIAISEWEPKRRPGARTGSGVGYRGIGPEGVSDGETTVAGKKIHRYCCSHERSHIMCSYGLSPFPQGEPCHALVWEGSIGSFYFVDKDVRIQKIGEVMKEPGNKYAFAYTLADPTMPVSTTSIRFDDAGKVMALAAYGAQRAPTTEERHAIETILSKSEICGRKHKVDMQSSPFFNIGVESTGFKDFARQLSDRLFETFLGFAERELQKGLPLIVSGGCGLNCEWNSRLKECGLFSDVFIPPCTNDSGVSIGAAIDAQRHYTQCAKVSWSVYCGRDFLDDVGKANDIQCRPLDLQQLCKELSAGKIIGWVQGRYEMGPRALGHRSVLAAPFRPETRARLNKIKQREQFRPIAPVCLEEELDRHFDHCEPSPFMLHFQRVKSTELQAVTHVDGSARVQSVNGGQEPILYALLAEFARHAGYGVLCNTSLNFKGRGFINRMSDLITYARSYGLDGFVVGQRYYVLDSQRSAAGAEVERAGLPTSS